MVTGGGRRCSQWWRDRVWSRVKGGGVVKGGGRGVVKGGGRGSGQGRRERSSEVRGLSLTVL